MTSAQVQTIRDRVVAGANKTVLAREFGVTRQTINNLIWHKVEAHLSDASSPPGAWDFCECTGVTGGLSS